STYAVLPVPLATTLSNECLTLSDVSSLMTLTRSFDSTLLIVSSEIGSIHSLAKCGSYKCPPLTAAATAITCWIGVTETPCPKDVVANSTGPTCSGLNKMPVPSPAKSIPVFRPKPNYHRETNSCYFLTLWQLVKKLQQQHFSTTSHRASRHWQPSLHNVV